MTACWVRHSTLIYFWRNMSISGIFYFSKLTSINTQYSSLWDTLEMMLITKYLIKWKRIGRISWKFRYWFKRVQHPWALFLKTAFSQNIKQLRTKYPMDLVRNVPRISKITVLLQWRPLLWSCSKNCAKINIFYVLSHKSITTCVSKIPVHN